VRRWRTGALKRWRGLFLPRGSLTVVRGSIFFATWGAAVTSRTFIVDIDKLPSLFQSFALGRYRNSKGKMLNANGDVVDLYIPRKW